MSNIKEAAKQLRKAIIKQKPNTPNKPEEPTAEGSPKEEEK